MNQHTHKQKQNAEKKPIHKDWRTWTVVVLMLIAMGIYVLSFDESFSLGGSTQEAPAPAEP